MSTGLDRRSIRRALISVYDKSGLVDLATALNAAGIEIVSTGSTAARIEEAGLPVTAVADLTGFPECLDGRVKTLHPRVHAGVLADMQLPEHVQQLAQLGIAPFELVIVNLYPFTQTVASGATTAECVEQIDIGGPTMVRAAAKNHANVAVVVTPDRYVDIVTALGEGGFTLSQRQRLAAEAFGHTASYDVAVATWMDSVLAPDGSGLPTWLGQVWQRRDILRYGENPHQVAAVYAADFSRPGLARAEQLHGREMSYNNFVDADAAWRAAYDHAEPAVAIIKHANPCGIAVGSDIADAYEGAFATDPVSAFGGVVASNRPVSVQMAHAMADVFTEVIVAPDFEPGALSILQERKGLRILRTAPRSDRGWIDLRPISGGILLQRADDLTSDGDDPATWRLVAGSPVDAHTMADLAFAWRSVRAPKSNAILLAKNGAAVGIGMGQVNRVDAARLAVARAGDERVRGAVAASDAFFPFPDGLEVLLDAGVRVVVQPGGSVRDDEVIAAAEAAGATMYFTGTRHFFH